MLPLARLRKQKPYKTTIHDIYRVYQGRKRKPMKAPFLLNPPAHLEKNKTIEEIKTILEVETTKLQGQIRHIEQDVAGQIYYPDPIADYPNLIQCIHLLAIHEQHHISIVQQYLHKKGLKKKRR